MTNLTPSDLRSGPYRQLEQIDYDKIVPFVQNTFKQHSRITLLYNIVCALPLLVFAVAVFRTNLSLSTVITQISVGLAAGFLLLLPHEYVHAFAYRYFGATQTKVVFYPRKLTAACVSDQFVIGGRPYFWVCIGPFLAITTLLLLLIMLLPSLFFIWLSAVFFHNLCCGGDFALVNYLWLRRNQPLYSYDDVSAQTMYFYTTISSP